MGLSWFVVSIVAILLVQRSALRIVRQANSQDGRGCPRCGFDLSGLPELGQCPECGRWYKIEDVQRQWEEAEAWITRKKPRR